MTLVISKNITYKKIAHCSVQPRDRIFVKGYGFLSFARNMDKNISNNLSSKCSQKLLDHAKQSVTNALKTTSKRAIQKTAKQLAI